MTKRRIIFAILAIFLIAGTATLVLAGNDTKSSPNTKQISKFAAPNSIFTVKIKDVDTIDATGFASAYGVDAQGAGEWYYIKTPSALQTQMVFNNIELGRITQSDVDLYTDSDGYVYRAWVT